MPSGLPGPPRIEPLEPRRARRGRSVGVAFALALTAAASLGSEAPGRRSRHATTASWRSPTPLAAVSSSSSPSRFPSCPPGSLSDGDSCVRWLDSDGEGLPEAESDVNAHRDAWGHWAAYDEIPRRPDRPADYDAYRYPIPCGPPTHRSCVVSGYDLDRADDAQRRARNLRQVGHGAVDLIAPRGTPIAELSLEHQEGDADVIYVGPLMGTTVVSRHTLREGGRLRDYVLFFGHLEAAAPGVRAGSVVRDGDLVGFVGDTGAPGVVHLHLEVRRVRDGVDPSKLAPNALIDGAKTVVCDPRNVLPVR